jgi:hypothetical protein
LSYRQLTCGGLYRVNAMLPGAVMVLGMRGMNGGGVEGGGGGGGNVALGGALGGDFGGFVVLGWDLGGHCGGVVSVCVVPLVLLCVP